MSEHLLCQTTPLCVIKAFVKAYDATAAFEAISCHLEFIHGVDVLDVHFDTRTVWRLRRPKIKILMPTSFKV